MKPESNNSALNALEAEALRWHVHLHGGEAVEADWLAFTDWLEANPAHNDAYDTIALAWDEAGTLGEAFEDASEQNIESANENTNTVIAFPFHRLRNAVKARPLAFGGGFGAAIAATLLVLMAPVFMSQNGMPGGLDYATGIGEQRTVTLDDGSTVILNTNSSITVRMNKKGRNIELNKGEALFTVTHEKNRPFIVAANGLNIHDIGTRFDVRLDVDRTLVSVTQGIVELQSATPYPQQNKQPLRLTKGQQAIRNIDNTISVRQVDPMQTTSWQQGFLVFENTELTTVVAELNRYFARPIRLVGEHVQNVRFSGILQISDQDRAVRDIAALESLSVVSTDTDITLRLDTPVHRQ
jgi:transmembrane sensor